MSRILVVEDDPLISTMVRLNLEQDGYHVELHSTADGARAALDEHRFDAILLDLGLPDGSGIEVARQARRGGIGTPILVLTARDDIDSKVQALDSGADDYLCKPFDMPELLARVRAHIRRSQHGLQVASEHELAIGRGRLDIERRALCSAQGRWIDLNDKEVVLLQFLAGNPRRPLSRAAILEEVWGIDAMPTERTVDNFIVRVRRWVELEPDQPRHIVTIRGFGYRYDP